MNQSKQPIRLLLRALLLLLRAHQLRLVIFF